MRKFNAFDVIVAQHLLLLCISLSKHQNMFQNFTGLVHQPVPLEFDLQFFHACIFLFCVSTMMIFPIKSLVIMKIWNYQRPHIVVYKKGDEYNAMLIRTINMTWNIERDLQFIFRWASSYFGEKVCCDLEIDLLTLNGRGINYISCLSSLS